MADQLYRTRVLLRHLEWGKALPDSNARRFVQADSLYKAGRAVNTMVNYLAARSDLTRARDLQRDVGDIRIAARSEVYLLQPRVSTFSVSERAEGYTRLAQVADSLGDPQLLCRALWRWGNLEAEEGSTERGIALYDSLLRVASRANDQFSVMWALRSMGGAQLMSGHQREGEEALRRYLLLNEAHGDSAITAEALINVSTAYYNVALLDSSYVYAKRALALSERPGKESDIARVCYALGLIRWYAQQHEEALHFCERARDNARECSNWWVEESAENIIGNIYGDNGDWKRAIPHYQRALELARANGDFIVQGYALANIALRMEEADSLAQAEEYYRAALSVQDSIPDYDQPDFDQRGNTLANLSWLAQRKGDTTGAVRLAEESFNLAVSVSRGNTGGELNICRAGYALARAWQLAGQLDQADSLYRIVIAAAKDVHRTSELWSASAALAEIAWLRGDSTAAMALLESSMNDVEEYRESLGSLSLRERWFASALAPFESMIFHCISQRREEEAFSCFERMKARELLDLLEGGHVIPAEEMTSDERREEEGHIRRIEELNRRTTLGEEALDSELESARDDYGAFQEELFRRHPELRQRRGRGEPISARDARRMLAPDEIALLYTIGSEQITLLAVTREKIKGFVLEGSAPSILRRIRVFRESLAATRERFVRHGAEELYRVLLSPAADLLRGKHRICLVPDDELYAVPFQALVDPEPGTFLAEQYAIYVVPSLSTLGSLRMKGSRGRRDMLAMGDPDLGTAPLVAMTLRGGLGPLPFSGQEVRSIAEIYAPRVAVFSGAEATEEAFKELAPNYGVLHLASHGLFDDRNPLYSSIALTPTASEDGFLEAREVMKLHLDADLVILSACETARGTITRGEGINGLTRAFFVAGVPTVVASLWTVDDESTALLMDAFHRRLRDGERPADALVGAEREVLSGDDRFRHPFCWAGFNLYGDSE
jgi:CHAT domain-containing protein